MLSLCFQVFMYALGSNFCFSNSIHDFLAAVYSIPWGKIFRICGLEQAIHFDGAILGASRDLIAVLPEVGEERSIVEFDISDFTVPDGEAIAEVFLEIDVASTEVAGLGQDGSSIPSELSLYGYIGNGRADLTDFDAGTFIESIAPTNCCMQYRYYSDDNDIGLLLWRIDSSYIGLSIQLRVFSP